MSICFGISSVMKSFIPTSRFMEAAKYRGHNFGTVEEYGIVLEKRGKGVCFIRAAHAGTARR